MIVIIIMIIIIIIIIIIRSGPVNYIMRIKHSQHLHRPDTRSALVVLTTRYVKILFILTKGRRPLTHHISSRL